MSFALNPNCDAIPNPSYVRKDCLPSPRRNAGRDDTSPARASTCSGMSGSSEDTSDSGFFQITPDVVGLSPRPTRPERELNGPNSNDGEGIDFFLKVVSEFRDYVTDKIDNLEDQHKANQEYANELQRVLKDSENTWTDYETKVIQEINHLVALLHKQQGTFIENIKKHRAKVTDDLREKVDICRRNMKIISGVISFARRVRNEKDDTIRENTLKELKQRFNMANERTLPPSESFEITRRELKLDALDEMKDFLERLVLGTEQNGEIKTKDSRIPVIIAQKSPSDVTKNSVVVRWTSGDEGSELVTYEVLWEFLQNGKKMKRSMKEITQNFYVVKELQPCCDVTVKVRSHTPTTSSEYSEPAFFKTLQQPVKFKFDSDTAHSKLQLSSDMFSVYFPGDNKNMKQKSPARFTFALNVLGNISFFSGRHYWEVLVNNDGWAVGLSYRNVPRNSWLGSNDSSWILHYNPAKGEYKMRHAGESHDVKISGRDDKISRVGIFIDYEAGILSFLDCYRKNILFTYLTGGFKEPVCAAVNPFYHGGVLTVITGLDIPDIDFLSRAFSVDIL